MANFVISVTIKLPTWRPGNTKECLTLEKEVLTMEMSQEVCMGLHQVDQHLQRIGLDNSMFR